MKFSPDLPSFLELSQDSNLIPVNCDFYGDTETPVTCYAKLRGTGPSFMLESVVGGESIGRYTFLGTQPRAEVRIYPERTEVRHDNGEVETHANEGDPLHYLEHYLAAIRTPAQPSDAPLFTGGAVGYVGYEYIHFVEPTVPMPERCDIDTPLAYFLITDTVVCFDHARQKLSIYSNAKIEGDPEAAYQRACDAIAAVHARLSAPSSAPLTPIVQELSSELEPHSNFSPERYCEAVRSIQDYITEGDVFQTVLSQRFETDYPHTALDLYRSLRNVNPSPYMTLLECSDFGIVSASPEVHVKVQGGKVEIRPIAGTRPRGATVKEDLALEKELLADTKEKAEHLMLVDLARNDIGRVCKTGSIEIPHFMIVERYSHVMHIVSQVLGELEAGKNAFDLLRATFPAGTISGAPKVRAMQIISELEQTQRGVYSGALGYFSFDGTHDSAIAIRTALLKNGKAYFQAGAGIVADSEPEKEYEETVNKAMGMLRAVQQSLGLVR